VTAARRPAGSQSFLLGSRRTRLSFQRTRMSADRTLMSIVRTAPSLIGFGFTIFHFFRRLRESAGAQVVPVGAARNFGPRSSRTGEPMATAPEKESSMTRRMIRFVVAAEMAALAAAGAAGAQTPSAPPPAASVPDRPGVVYADRARTTATVKAVDREKRTVTLESAGGRVVTVNVPSEAQNFDRVQVGDKVNVEFLDAVALFVRKTDAPPAANEVSEVRLAPKGGTPGGVMVNVVEVTARVEGIDYDTRKVTLRGPDGNTRVVTVDPRVQRLNEVKPGDEIVVRHTEALSLRLDK
jgi:Cu/Ag efflux protein CusF